MVFSNSNNTATPRSIAELFSNLVLAKRYMFGNFNYINVYNISDKTLYKHKVAGLLEAALKYKNSVSIEELLIMLADLINNLYNITSGKPHEDHIDDYVISLIRYSVGESQEVDLNHLRGILESKLDDDRGSRLMQRIYQEPYEEGKFAGIDIGKAEGKVEGFITTAKNMLAQGMDANLIAKCSGLSIAEIEKIKS